MTTNLTLAQAKPLIDWCNEREAIRLRKACLTMASLDDWDLNDRAAWGESNAALVSSGRSDPKWSLSHLTDDPILHQYRFCNVRREDDRVTVWIRENIREPFADHAHLWFMLAIARYINWPPALQDLIKGDSGAENIVWDSWPHREGFTPPTMTHVLEARKARGVKCETGAYMIRAESDKNAPWYSWSKQRYVCEIVLGHLWDHRDLWQGIIDGGSRQPTLQEVWERFQESRWTGWGPFMAYQVVVDLRWTCYLRDAPDIQTWAALGPGSRRGLNRLHGRDTDYPLKQDQGLGEMIELRELLKTPSALAPWVPLPDLSDVQNALCETDKYMRVKAGEGRPRAKYVPGRGS